MIYLTDTQLHEVAGELETGMSCYIHRQTGELVSFPDPDQFSDIDEQLWGPVMDTVSASPEDYIEVTPMSSRELFLLMEQFVEEVVKGPLQERLFRQLSQPKPFRRFKDEIDHSEVYRQRWFTFRDQKTVDWLKQQLDEAD